MLAVRWPVETETERDEYGDDDERTKGVKADEDGEEGAETRQPDLFTSIKTCS